MINFIISALTGQFASWFKEKQETDKLVTVAKIEAGKTHLAGYSDEYLLVVWSYPFISMFIPQLYAHTVQGFERLALLPDWYVGGFISITFAVFGIDKLFKYKKAGK